MNVNKKVVKKGLLPYVFLLLVMLLVVYFVSIANQKVNVLTYDEFMSDLDDKEVSEITVTPRERAQIYEITGKLDDYEENESFFVRVPLSDQVMKKLVEASDTDDFEFTSVADPESSTILLVLANVLPIAILAFICFWFLSKQMGGGKNSFDFGKSKAKLSSDKNKVTFKDVAGLTEEKEEVKELIDFLKNPKKFQKLGARIPKGVLLYGPPGTGKTLLARAVAGEANVPFYYISGSDFVELFVGVGASRVRDMFQQAKRTAPCLIFIDEIDAVGRQRGTGIGGGHDEREQTLNQLLTEMDGFGENEGIIIIAATNRPDVLDPALLRPGRFDRRVIVDRPDLKGRVSILKVHAKNVLLDETVDLDAIALATSGAVGSDLANMINEAAILAVKHGRKAVSQKDLLESAGVTLSKTAYSLTNYTKLYNAVNRSTGK